MSYRLIGKGSSDAATAHRYPNFLKSPPTKLIRVGDINLPFNSPFEPFAYSYPKYRVIRVIRKFESSYNFIDGSKLGPADDLPPALKLASSPARGTNHPLA
jgi:hypothetical protein